MFNYIVSLQFFHPSRRLADVGPTLGMTPKRIWAAGEARTAPNGRPLGGVNTESYTVFDIDRGHDGELVEVLRAVYDRLSKHAPFFKEFVASGGKVAFFVSWHSDRDTGVTLDAPLLAGISSLGIDLGINVLDSRVGEAPG